MLIALLLDMNYGGEKTSLDLTHHRGTIGMHRSTMSHKDPRGTMRSDPFPKLHRFAPN
jgi:hypothetical protein